MATSSESPEPAESAAPHGAGGPVVVERRGPALWARIDRPGTGNSCGSAVMAGLEGWLDRAAEPGVRVLVLTGTGRSFCAGADMAELQALLGDPDALTALLGRGRALVRRLRAAAVPTVAAVNGAAFGGGMELLMACDIAVAVESARFSDRHARVGQVPAWGASVMLPSAVGPALARRLMITGETWTALQAARHGLIGEVVPDDGLDAALAALVDRLAGLDAAAVTAMLRVARPLDDERLWAREEAVLGEHLAAQAASHAASHAAAGADRPAAGADRPAAGPAAGVDRTAAGADGPP